MNKLHFDTDVGASSSRISSFALRCQHEGSQCILDEGLGLSKAGFLLNQRLGFFWLWMMASTLIKILRTAIP